VSSAYSIRRFDDADGFLGRALDWLLESEAEHNLIVSIARRAAEAPTHVNNAYYATIESSGDVIGCVLRTPPYKLVVSDFPPDAAPFVSADIGRTYNDVPAVLGPETSARAFADAWCAPRGLKPRIGMRQRVYQLQQVRPPEHSTGSLQVAAVQHIDLITGWIEDFSAESGVPTARARALGEERILRGELFVWEVDGVPCSMAAWSGSTPNGVRIGYVYTPPKLRGRGYASACVAEVSQRALDAGFNFCFLFTDLSNPVSNSIYQRIGYLPVSDVVDFWLT
jgi:predicted GNAT family acetyltransferase